MELDHCGDSAYHLRVVGGLNFLSVRVVRELSKGIVGNINASARSAGHGPRRRRRVTRGLGPVVRRRRAAIGVSVAGVALGATVVEKHFTLSRAEGGVDSAFSLEPHEMQTLVVETGRAWEALGHVSYGPTAAEIRSLQYRRSLYVTADLRAGDVLDASNVRAIRPGLGLPRKHLTEVLGCTVTRDVPRGTPLSWSFL